MGSKAPSSPFFILILVSKTLQFLFRFVFATSLPVGFKLAWTSSKSASTNKSVMTRRAGGASTESTLQDQLSNFVESSFLIRAAGRGRGGCASHQATRREVHRAMWSEPSFDSFNLPAF